MIRIFELGSLAFWVMSLAVTGCSGPSDANQTGAGGSSSANAGGNNSVTGGAGGSGSVNGGAGQGGSTTGNGGPVHEGHFVLLSLVMAQTRAAQASASFYTAASPLCTVQTFGDCALHSNCALSVNSVSAGTLTVTSAATATLPANNVSMVPNADSAYDNGVLSGLFSGAEALHIAASGGTVPAFSADVSAPLVITIDAPTPDSNGIIHATTTSDLTIQFSRGTSDVVLSAQVLGGGSPDWLECTSSKAGSMIIPTAALAAAGGPLSLLTRATRNIIAGDFTVTVGVYMNAYTQDKLHPVQIQFN